MHTNDLGNSWDSAWLTLQKALANTEGHKFRVQSGVLGASSWLGRARDRGTGVPRSIPRAA
jgi:hypothetical protein